MLAPLPASRPPPPFFSPKNGNYRLTPSRKSHSLPIVATRINFRGRLKKWLVIQFSLIEESKNRAFEPGFLQINEQLNKIVCIGVGCCGSHGCHTRDLDAIQQFFLFDAHQIHRHLAR